MERFGQHYLELVSKEEFRLMRPLDTNKSALGAKDDCSSMDGRSHGDKDANKTLYGLILTGKQQ